MQKERLKKLTRCAILIALATALSLAKIYQMPLGGSVTLLSMLPICLISYMYGTGWGIACAFLYSLIQMFLDLAAVLSWGLSPVAVVGTVFLDYLFAFTVLGLAGVFGNKRSGALGIMSGTVLAFVARFACHLISGTVIFDIWLPEEWSNPFLYSVVYNGQFMLPKLILTAAALGIFIGVPYIRKNFLGRFFSEKTK